MCKAMQFSYLMLHRTAGISKSPTFLLVSVVCTLQLSVLCTKFPPLHQKMENKKCLE
uniref:Uncharacterized protein n=1 Tax=Arundo donax TaxID=35708 RepID=A0A0A9DL51_ARUDO